MIRFIIGWCVTLIGIKLYLSKKNANIGIDNNIISIGLSFSIVLILTIIQILFDFIINLII